MAVGLPPAETRLRPTWPESPFDPDRAYVRYGWYADEFVLYFDATRRAAISDPIDAPEGGDTAVLVGLGPNDEDSGEIVGIHIYPLMAGAALHHPHWRALAEPNLSPELLVRFVAEARELFDRYWTFPPPIEKQPTGLCRERADLPNEPTVSEALAPAEAVAWQTADRSGREVVVSEARLARILRKRPGMADRVGTVRLAVEAPERVTRDDDYLHREYSYRRAGSDQFLKVAVHYHTEPLGETWAGEVTTAYLVDRVDPREVLVWP